MGLFWVLAGWVANVPPLSRRLLAVAMVAGSIPLWFAPIHCRIEQGIGEQKPLAAIFSEEYDRFKELRALRMPPEPKIYRPPQGKVHTRTGAPQIQSKPTVRPGVDQQPDAEVTVPRPDE